MRQFYILTDIPLRAILDLIKTENDMCKFGCVEYLQRINRPKSKYRVQQHSKKKTLRLSK